MKRRNLFRLLACAVAASAMDVMGLVPVKAPGVPRTEVETLWQRVHYMNDGRPFVSYCVSRKHPDSLTLDELSKGMAEGEKLLRSATPFPTVDLERAFPLGEETWEDVKP